MRVSVPCAAAVVLSLVVSAATAQESKKFADLLKRVPDNANVIALIDVDGLLNSPMGVREKWRDEFAKRPDGAIGLGGAASQTVVATSLDFQTMDEQWKLALARLNRAPGAAEALAKREGGYVEQIENHDVVWTPRNFYVVPLPDRTVALAMPASRQLLVKWLRDLLLHPRGYPSGWSDRAIFRAEHGSQIVIAVELVDSVSPRQAEAWLRTVDAVTNGKHEPKLLAPELASVTSALLEIEVGAGMTGTLRVEFGKNLDAVKPIAKAVVLEALGDIGAELDDLKAWDGEVKGSAVELSGPISEASVRRLLAVIGAPSLSTRPPTGPGAAADVEEPAPADPTEQDVIKASQQYFRSVVDIVDALKQQRDESYSRIRLWLDRSAKQIDELPILNVDTDLLNWGAKVSLTLREMSGSINYINKDKSYRLAGSAKGSYTGWWGGGTWNSMDSRSTTTQANAMINVDATARWQALQTAIGEARRAMVQKYKVNF